MTCVHGRLDGFLCPHCAQDAADRAYLQACSELVERIARPGCDDPWYLARVLLATHGRKP